MKVPKRFEAASLTDWDKDHPIRVIGVQFLQNLDKYVNAGQAPVFAGITGRGKSRGAAAILNAIKQYSTEDVSTGWFSSADVFNLLADLRDARATSSYFELLSQIQDLDIVVIDDMTALRETPRLREYLWMVLNHRYEELKPTIITVNSTEKTDIAVLKELSIWSSQSIARRVRDCAADLFTIV